MSLDLFVDTVEGVRLVVGHVGSGLVCADGDPMSVRSRELPPKSDVIDLSCLRPKVRGEVQCEMGDGREGNNPKKYTHYHILKSLLF